MSKKRDRWAQCGRNSEKAIRTIRRTANENNVPLQERQTGSHWIGKVPGRGSVVVPRHNGEIPRGTWGSILRTLKFIGIIAAGVVLLLIFNGYISVGGY